MEERAIKDNVEYGQWELDILKNNFTIEQIEAMDLPVEEIDLTIFDEEEMKNDPDADV